MLPMKRLSSTPYALNAGMLGGRTAAGFIQNNAGTPQAANISIQSADAADVAAIIQGAAGQTADIFQVKADSVATPLLAVSNAGSVTITPTSDASAALIVNSTSGNILTASASSIALNQNTTVNANLLVKPSVDAANAFEIQNAAGETQLNFSTTSGILSVGSLSLTPSGASESLWNDGPVSGSSYYQYNAITLGTIFKPTVSGQVTGVKFYNPAGGNAGTFVNDTGKLWACTDPSCNLASGGTALASVTFTNDTSEGWKSAKFGSPVSVTAGTYYIVTHFSGQGIYQADSSYFASSYTSSTGKLFAPSDTTIPNGVFSSTTSDVFPNSNVNQTNYWTDVMFVPSSSGDTISTTNSLNIVSGGQLTLGSTAHSTDLQGDTINLNANTVINLNQNVSVANTKRLSVGSNGTATGQLYVSGDIPSASIGSVATGITTAQRVVVQGKYAFVLGNQSGTRVRSFNVSNPTSPVAMGTFTDSEGSSSNQLSIEDGMLFTSSADKFIGINISNPNSPVSSGSSATISNGGGTGAASQGRYAFVASGSNLQSFDTTSGSMVSVQNLSSGLTGNGNTLATQGAYLYVGSASNISVVNIANPAAMSVTSTVAYGSSVTDIKVNGAYVYAVSSAGNNMKIYNVANPTSAPVSTGSLTLTTSCAPNGLTVSGRYAYVACSGAANGIQIVNISNPASPVSVGVIGATTGIKDVTISGRYLYAIDNSQNLQVYDTGGAYIQQLEAGSIETTKLTTGDLTVINDISVRGGVSTSDLLASGDVGIGGTFKQKTTINSTTAFSIQNASGGGVFTVDTQNSLAIAATFNATSGYQFNGTSGATTTCGSGEYLDGAVVQGGIVTGGTCATAGSAGSFVTLQTTTPGTADVGNFNINGTGIANVLQATSHVYSNDIDTATAGTLNIGATNATSVVIGKTNGTAGITLSANTITLGNGTGTTSLLGAAQTTSNTNGAQLTIQGSTGNGTGNGGTVTVQGGNGGSTNGNGGTLELYGGTGVGSGVTGLVKINTATYATASVQNSTSTTSGINTNITQANVDGLGVVIVNATGTAQSFTLGDPSLGVNAAGRVIYVTAANGSNDFTLAVNSGGAGNQIAMRQNTTATMIWNGADWTAAGASSSTTLQSAYDNTLQSAGGAELVVSSGSNTNGLTIRDSSVSPVNGRLLSVQTSSAADLISVNGNVTEYATDAGAEVAGGTSTTFPSNTWSAISGATVSRHTTTGNYIATGQGSVKVITNTTAGSGVKDQFTGALTAKTNYNVSFAARLDSSSSAFTNLEVYYSNNGTAASTLCVDSKAVPTSVWTKVNCTFAAPASGITSSNALFIRQTGSGTAHTLYVDNLSVTIAADYNYATDGGVSDNTNFATNWTSVSGASVTRDTTTGNDASDSARVVTTGSGQGVRNKLSINPLASTLYRVTAYANLSSGSFNNFTVRYSRDGGSNFATCADYNTQTIPTGTSYTKVTCYIKTDATTATNPYVYFTQTDGTGRTFYVDTFSMTLSSLTTPNVQIGGGISGGPTTLFTLDRGASAPIASDNEALLGSMYYDTSLGKLQCYEADGWGACGSSPDNIVTISPEYTNAVLHGTGIGTMTSDICSSTLGINDGTSGQDTICGSGETYNFYKWTSPQSTDQTYSVYVTYQLPGTFKSFNSGQTSLMARTDDGSSGGSATVKYQIYRNSASGLTPCGAAATVSTGTVSSWQTKIASGSADPSTCGFNAGDSIVFKIDVIASRTASAYVGNLNFAFSNR